MNLSPPRTKSSPLYERMDYEEEENYHGGDDDDELKEFLEGGEDLAQQQRSRKPQWKSMSSSSTPKRGRNSNLSNPNNNTNRCHYITIASITVNLILATTIIYVLSSSPSLRISPFSLSSSSGGSSNSVKHHNNVTNISDEDKDSSSSSSGTTRTSIGSNTKYSHIALLGERNSGTTWTHAHLEQCFGDQISVRNRLTRHKHWFQEDLSSRRERAADDLESDNDNDDDEDNTRRQRRRTLFDYGKTLVIAQFRDPVYWVDAMRRKPHHSPMHYGYEKNQWREFLSIPWTLPVRPANDQRHVEQFTLYKHDPSYNDIFHPPCHEGFMPHQMMTCLRSPWAYVNEVSHDSNERISTNTNYADGDQHGKINQTAYEEYMKQYQPLGKKSPKFSGYLPRYERHPTTGEVYQNVLDLRRDKIYNFIKHVATWEWTSDSVRIERYEDLVANGTQSLIEYVEQETGLKANCTPYPPQPNRIVHNPWNNDDDEKEFLQYLHKHMDWEAEALIGYYPTTY